MSRHPEVKWAQREDKIFITVLLADTKDSKVNVEPEGVFKFSATAGADNHYELMLELFDKINVEESKINIGPRSIFCVLEKAESKWWNKLLKGDARTPHYVKVDWDKWVDEDDDPAPADAGMDGMDFSSMGGMGGMPGMGGMGGMGGMPGMEALAGMGGMGGMGMGGMGGMPGMEALASMGGMGGMGGMPGMGGMGGMPPGMGDFSMGDDFDDSDDEVQEATKPAGEDNEKVGEETKTGVSEEKAEAPSST